MSNKPSSVFICDIGGTHARFAIPSGDAHYTNYKKYKLADFQSLADIIQAYCDETNTSYNRAIFSLARMPVNGVVNYKRFAGDPDFVMDFNALQNKFAWDGCDIYNDLEAAAMGLDGVNTDDVQCVIPADSLSNHWNDYKILLSVGTGIGHACVMDGRVLKSPGGHWLPVTVTDEQRAFESYLRKRKNDGLSLIMEDFISGRGLKMMTSFITGKNIESESYDVLMDTLRDNPDVIRLFFEMLGLYAHTMVSTTGFYGGVYITGGVIDHLVTGDLTNWDAFAAYMRPNMLPTVNDRLGSVPVYYLLHHNLPLVGLSLIKD